ncbi:hypothetical protein WG908_15910 [Sphingobium sp. AN641]|uniref:hypothetical protein n=1 Tax=Sphingobium sp. AN641 TaxID=3133443 RepID=UPI0030C5E182
MRARMLMAVCAVAVAVPAMADVLEMERDNILRGLTRQQVAGHRQLCVTGAMQPVVDRERSAGFRRLSTGAYCVTVLTRAGRDSTLRYVTLKTRQATPAVSFDTGFVSGYLKREALPSDAPPMAPLLPVADRCLAQSEPNTRLCSSVGYVLGARAARGELVPLS